MHTRCCIFILNLVFLFIAGCSINSDINHQNKKIQDESPQSFSFVTWNVQTFFDAEKQGKEYAEFQKDNFWDVNKYKQRLDRLCETIILLNADVYAFEEIENQDILYDISNRLQSNSWKKKNKWTYGCFTKQDGAAIGVALISKYPIMEVKSHTLDIRVQKETQPSMRPVLECSLQINQKDVTFFVNHWKSKSGGAEETEIWRDWQESLLSSLLLSRTKGLASHSLIACGDFNRNAKAFIYKGVSFEGQNNTFLRAIPQNEREFKACGIQVFSPWFDYIASEGVLGSYFFEQSWEQIDNVFCTGPCKITRFKVCASENLITDERIPNAYKIYSGSGYSDHLPLFCTVLLN